MLFQDTEIAALEALLFVAKEPLSLIKISELLEISQDNTRELTAVLKERYESASCGFMLIEVENGFRLGTKPELARYIEILYKQPTQVLSNAALEVLSIIAYKQPITRGEIDFIRGVQSEKALSTVLEKGLIKEVGRKDGPGRPILYGTTEAFLVHFGIKSITDLPPLEIFKVEEDGVEEDGEDEAGEGELTESELGEATVPAELAEEKTAGHEVEAEVGQDNDQEVFELPTE